MTSPIHPSTQSYHRWRAHQMKVRGAPFTAVTKPGVFAHGREDTAALLLAENIDVDPHAVVVNMNCGGGLFGAVARGLGEGGKLLMTDRNVVSCEAARRTIAANDIVKADVYEGQGAQALPEGIIADIVAIRVPQDRLSVQKLLRDALELLPEGGRCYLAGANNEGIKTAVKTLESVFGKAFTLAHGGGHRVAVAEKRASASGSPDLLNEPLLRDDVFHELDATLAGRTIRLYTRPGVFSWDHLDEATAILAEHVEIAAGDSVLDLGCGAGALGVYAGMLATAGSVCMVDADTEAVRSAARSAEAAGLRNYRVLASDVGSAVMGERFDVVVTNPPFHVGKATDLELPLQFIEDAWSVLSPGGRLFLVANRTLPYEVPIRRRFGNQQTLHDGARFKVLGARKEV